MSIFIKFYEEQNESSFQISDHLPESWSMDEEICTRAVLSLAVDRNDRVVFYRDLSLCSP